MIRRALLGAALALLGSQALAGTQTCSVTATNLAFGSFTGSRIDTTAVIRLICNGGGNNNPYSVALSQGVSNSFIDRFMLSPAQGELTYNMYIDPGRSIIWGNGAGQTQVQSGILDFRHTGAVTVPLIIYGRVPFQTLPAPGQYSDNILITVTF